ncbi:MAG: cell division protein ZapE [Gammaproteobacteria bacterium]
MRTPGTVYEDQIASGFTEDAAQRHAVAQLDRVFAELTDTGKSGWTRLFPYRRRPVRGLYLWGGVGRGKTWLMDLFHDCLPFDAKHRRHFHRFMHDVHAELKTLEQQEKPLDVIAARWAEKARVLCFDEFFVSDIGDAVILGTLLDGLMARGVTLVATSNVPPQELYAGGLQRARFLPAIDLIKGSTDVVHLDSDIDYRLRALERAELYHSPLDDDADRNLELYFDDIAPERGTRGGEIEIEGRIVPYRRRADGIIWLGFDAICGGPRSVADYIEIARCFATVIVSGIPSLDGNRENEARRFIALVDEFYDRSIKLIVSATRPLDRIYTGNRLSFEFERTRSRLEEMQSHDYLARPHKP